MTLHRSFMLLAVTLGVVVVVLFGCSSDDDDDDDIVAPEEEPVVEREPPMGWDGGRNIRITVGGKTEKELYMELYDKELLFPNFLTLSRGPYAAATRWEGRFNFPHYPFAHSQYFSFSEEEYIIDVTVISMLEAGMEEPATIEEIRARYRELGCRPMTAEEVFYLRLQFTDQPYLGMGRGDPLGLGEFFALMEDNKVDVYGPYLLGLVHHNGMREKFIVKRFVGHSILNSFDPHFQEIWEDAQYGVRRGADFACVKIQ